MNKFIQKSIFIVRFFFLKKLLYLFRRALYSSLGMEIGNKTILPAIRTTFPNQVSIGKNCVLERDIFFKYDGPWKSGFSICISDNVFIGQGCEFNISESIEIGQYSNIASGCKFIDHDHGIKADMRIGPQPAIKKAIVLEEDVWLGVNVIILKGVTVGTGAVVGAGAVVVKSIPANEIWGGIPAKKIGVRQ